jgi:hypothetical protein
LELKNSPADMSRKPLTFGTGENYKMNRTMDLQKEKEAEKPVVDRKYPRTIYEDRHSSTMNDISLHLASRKGADVSVVESRGLTPQKAPVEATPTRYVSSYTNTPNRVISSTPSRKETVLEQYKAEYKPEHRVITETQPSGFLSSLKNQNQTSPSHTINPPKVVGRESKDIKDISDKYKASPLLSNPHKMMEIPPPIPAPSLDILTHQIAKTKDEASVCTGSLPVASNKPKSVYHRLYDEEFKKRHDCKDLSDFVAGVKDQITLAKKLNNTHGKSVSNKKSLRLKRDFKSSRF